MLQAAIADLNKAQLNLLRTSILAPSDGAVTGLQLSPGVQANAGQPVMTFIDLRDIWIVAYLTENNLGNVQSGDSVEIAFDVFPGKVFHGTVQSIGFGVEVEDTSVAGTLPSGLPGASVTSGDLRFPMRITINSNKYPKSLRFGARTSVVVLYRCQQRHHGPVRPSTCPSGELLELCRLIPPGFTPHSRTMA